MHIFTGLGGVGVGCFTQRSLSHFTPMIQDFPLLQLETASLSSPTHWGLPYVILKELAFKVHE